MAETFSDLPDALVRDLLAKATPVAESVEHRLVSLRQQRDRLQSVARLISSGSAARQTSTCRANRQ